MGVFTVFINALSKVVDDGASPVEAWGWAKQHVPALFLPVIVGTLRAKGRGAFVAYLGTLLVQNASMFSTEERVKLQAYVADKKKRERILALYDAIVA